MRRTSLAVVVGAAAVVVGVAATAMQAATIDVFWPNIVVAILSAAALMIALARAIVVETGATPVPATYLGPVAVLVVTVWGEWAYSRGEWALPSGFVYAGGVLACLYNARRKWPVGQLALYALLSLFAFAGGALSGAIWGVFGDSRTDEVPLLAMFPAVVLMLAALATASFLTVKAKLTMAGVLVLGVASSLLPLSEAARLLCGALVAAIWVWQLRWSEGHGPRNVSRTPGRE